MKLFSSSYFFLTVVLLQLCLWVVVKYDPFFGDSIASTSKAALAIYDSGFQTVFYPEAIDPGHPTLYPLLMALCWSIAGPYLWVSHLVSVCCMLFLLWSLRKCCMLFVPLPFANIAVLLSCCFATTISMSAMMLNTTLLMAFCLMVIYALVTEKRRLFMVVASAMMLVHLQAAYFLLALAAADCWITIRQDKQTIGYWIKIIWLKYTLPFAVFMVWLWMHYQHTGWLLHSPNYSDSASVKGVGSFVKSLVLIAWRLVDYGMLPVHCITAIALFRKKVNNKLAAVFCILLLVTSVIMAFTLEHTIGHRYFLVFQLLSIGIAVSYLAQLKSASFIISICLVLIGLVAGNFLSYPGKTLGDATLAYRSYFAIEKQLEQEHGNMEMYSYAPIANPPRSKWLTEGGLPISRIVADSLNSYPVILQSNVNAEFASEQRMYLEKNWYGKSYERGAVYVNIFLNPKYYQKPEGWVLRKPSWIEQQVTDVKNKIGR
ncbi:MAG: hypothetical protein V4590_01940 [Bacteroidota bacterium]